MATRGRNLICAAVGVFLCGSTVERRSCRRGRPLDVALMVRSRGHLRGIDAERASCARLLRATVQGIGKAVEAPRRKRCCAVHPWRLGPSTVNLELHGVSFTVRFGSGLRPAAPGISALAPVRTRGVARAGVSGTWREAWLWSFVGRAHDPYRSTARVSTWTRATCIFCSVY